jgi:DNA-binding beta-propeller fold protein YncE
MAVTANLTSSTPVLNNLGQAVAVDVHVSRRLIFWSDTVDKSINRAYIDGSNPTVIVKNMTGMCTGLAVEWTTNLLYWTNEVLNLNIIAVAKFDGQNRKVLIYSLDKPRGIAVDPQARYIYIFFIVHSRLNPETNCFPLLSPLSRSQFKN